MDPERLTLRIRHRTTLDYSNPVGPSYNEVRLRPRDGGTQRLTAFSLVTTPSSLPRPRNDYYGNVAHRVDVEVLHDRLEIIAEALVSVRHTEAHAPAPWSAETLAVDPRLEFALPSPRVQLGGAATALWREWTGGDPSWDALFACAVRMRDEFGYVTGVTTVDTSIDEFLVARSGVCQEFTHLFLAMSRSAGWPARYVSGYLGPPPDQTTTRGASHAWVEICGSDGRWVAVDPTHGGAARPDRVVLAVGRDYDDVAPHRGLFFGAAIAQPADAGVEVSRRESHIAPTPASTAEWGWNAQRAQQQQRGS